jgi:phosphoribosyl 1,2-cyclic phosphodiesterase/CheY-like chemotaxis protein
MKKRVLIIEDDPAILDFAALVLDKGEFEVEKASDGRQGLEKAKDFKPDLVVLDLMMPVMHGYEVCQNLRQDKSMAALKILITSSKSYAQDMENAESAGADDYLVKPYNGSQLLAKAEELLRRNGTASTPTEIDTQTRRSSQVQASPVGGESTGIQVKFWGVRGSSPAPGPKTIRYGGNTSCTEIRFGDELVIIDSGTGIRELGMSLMAESKDKPVEGHIFVGHTHWDHIQGFPFFTPLYIPKNKFRVYSVRGAGKSLERVFKGQMAADYFPVPLQSLSSQLEFIELEEPVEIGRLRVDYHFLNHPGVAIGYRFTFEGRSVSYISDHETFARLSGESDLTLRQDKQLVDFIKGTDLLICDAQYTEEEYKLKRGWGHSTLFDVVDRAIAAEVKHVMLFHHDPTHTDELMDKYLEECQARIRDAGANLRCSAAQEGLTTSL